MRDVEIPNWLKGLPLAPEYRPTDTEFADPIAYISKIEKEASAFGICKVIPPLPKPSKKYVLHNLNRSLSKSPEFTSDAPSKMLSGDEEVPAVFTTRHQELGQNVKKSKGAVQSQQPTVQKQVWQSGEVYTLEQFESKSKVFARSLLSMIREVSPLVVEAMFWKAATEKPIYVEYANDVPGSGFGEPEGSFRYFLKRRRKRIFKKNCGASSVCRNHDVDATAMNFYNDENSVMTNKLDSNISVEIPKASSGSSTLPSDETSQVSRQKRSNVSSEMEGTAGWKLSNSPWNLQVIARSPGSLTRFMPDDIPGVTSPMVYIGMLFSWFAWHVEDHELHSLNYLHTGSPKTWYAVPGDFAFAFEEVIRTQAYGGNIDRLAALKLLGEKTTLLSPELVIASGIPCCRLIQHPGEFVVTFPRAYHVGFSHGFNCGEAANFGTPQWLQVAKGAAVRRAAMSYLPMLSHQQLLYLLTMSFVSRVPRSLLPGARSSRLRDRQKEERELSVKKAFIEDILNENKLLTVLLEKESTYHAVLWNPESLPSSSKESHLPNGIATVATTSKEKVTNPEEKNSYNNLFDEMSSYMETVNGLYLDDDDLSCDFQVDSGILACVACGILGFPFMSVVQPSGKAFMELMPVDHSLVQEGSTVSKSINSHISSDVDGIIKGTFSENLPHVPDHSVPQEDRPIPSTAKLSSGWIASSRFTRPHIFCLEHAVQIEELLRTKGGANVLVICHSDYQKMKAHAVATAEEIGCLFKYNEVPMESASHEDLDLINLAIAEERDECGEDWTAKLGINLRYCVKVQKNSPSKQVQHALTLGGLFSDMTPASTLSIKWQSRRPRSKLKLNHSANVKPCESIQIKDTNLREQLNGSIVKNENKIIQYTRRNSNLKSASSARAGKGCAHPKEIKSSTCGNLDKCDTSRNSSTGSDAYASVGKSEMQHEVQALATSDLSKDFFPVQVASHATSTSSVRSVEAQIKTQTLEETNMDGKACNLLPTDSSEMRNKMNISEESSEKNETTFAGISSSLVIVVPTVERSEMQIDIIMEETKLTNEVRNPVTLNTSGGHCDILTDGDVLNMVSDGANFPSSHVSDRVVETCDVPIEGEVAEIFCTAGEFSDFIAGNNVIQQEIKTNDRNTMDAPVSKEACAATELSRSAILEDKMLQEIQTTNSPAQESDSRYVTPTDQHSGAPMEKRTIVPQESRTAACSGMILDDKVVQEAEILNGNSTKKTVSSVTLTDQHGTAPVQERSESPQGTCAAGVIFNGVSSDKKVWQEIQTTNESGKKEPISGRVTVIDQLTTPGSVGESSNVLIEIHASDDLCHCMTLDNEPHKTHATKRSEDRPIQGIATVKNPLTPASTGESPCNDVTSSNELDREIQAVSRRNREEHFLSCLTLINQTSLASVEESPKVLTETCAEYDLCATSNSEWEQEIPTASKSNGEEPVSSCLTWINQNSLASEEESPKLLTETCTEYDSSKCATLDNEVPSPASVEESSEVPKGTGAEENLPSCGEVCFSQDKSELENIDESTSVDLRSNAWKERKRKRKTEAEHLTEDNINDNGFIRSPCEGLRSRARKDATGRSKTDMNKNAGKNPIRKNTRKSSASSVPCKDKKENTKGTHSCDLDGCRMSFKTKAELLLHKRNQCPHPGCGKIFSSHKYALLHERVHDDDRPIKCPWKGCTMSFKWAWAKIEHLRVHTGERPYQCKIEGCGLSFRFISDFSRHRRKTGHHHVN